MRVITAIGQVGIRVNDRNILLNPSFNSMSRLGDAQAIVELFAAVHGSGYPQHQLSGSEWLTAAYKRGYAEMVMAAWRIVTACTDEDITDVTGTYRVLPNGNLRCTPGAMSVEDMIQLGRHLIVHGVTGVQEREDYGKKDGEYSDKFDVSAFVYLAVAHLGLSEESAWGMTMTGFRAAMKAKYPPDPAKKLPSQSEYDEAMGWADALMAADAGRTVH